MENTTYVALSHLTALRRMLDVTANNVANMNTAGFRAERPVFDDFVERAGAKQNPIAFVIDRATYTDLREATIVQSGNPLDVAIRGEGYLAVETAEGIRYTRDGRMNRDTLGQLVTVDGHLVLSDDGAPILIPDDAERVTIAADGEVRDENDEPLGRLGLFAFDNPQALLRGGDGLYEPVEEPFPAVDATVVQGSIETSNVQPIAEMVRLIDLTRAYASINKVMEQEHERQRNTINELGNAPTA